MSRAPHNRSIAVFASLFVCLFAWQTTVSAQADREPGDQSEVTPPQVLVDAGLLSAVQAEDAERAGLAWAEVLASVEPAPWPEDRENKPAGAMPHEAAELLKQSESAIKNGKAFRAVQLLRQAEAIAPNHPTVRRALGLAYAESGNLTRAAHLLRAIASADRDDVEALLLLARHATQSGELETTLAYAQALEQTQAPVVADYYLATVLSDLGYTAAASERLGRVLDAVDAIDLKKLKEQGKAPALLARELLVIQQITPQLRIQQGDLLLRSGADERAAEVYAAVELEDAPARHALIARRVYLALRGDDQATAIDQVIALLSRSESSAADAQLISYLRDQGVPAEALTTRIEAMLQASGITLTRLAALSAVADKQRLLEPINNWLSVGPVTPERLIQAVTMLAFDDAKPADAKALSDLLKLVANLMQQSPEQASAYAHAAIKHIDAPVTLLRAIRSEAFAAEPNDYERLLSAVVYEQTGRVDDALLAYEPLLASDAALSQQVLVPTVRLHLALGQGEQAHELVGEPNLDAGQAEFDLAVRAMAAAGKPHAALDLLDQRIQARGKQLHLDILRIEMIAQMGQPQQACNLLLRLISSQPSDASLYRLGIDLAYDYRTDFNRVADADRMRRAFLTRLISNLPDAPLSRISMAQNIMSNPARGDEAEELLLQVLKDEPKNAGALSLLVELYDQTGDEVAAQAMFDRYTRAIRPGVMRALVIAERAVALEQMKRATKVLDTVIELDEQGVLPGPALTGDQASSLLQYLEAADAERDTDALYVAMVRRFPDHAGLNNALGYRWALQDKNLLQAKAMITRALKENSTNHSIIDSLAWVQYKLGEFDEAKATQSQALMVLEARLARIRGAQFGLPEEVVAEFAATTAILNDHMGDILYKLGQPREALDHWRVAAKQRYTEQEMRFDPELRTLQARLKAKVDAMAKDQPAPVAPVPGPESHGPEGHPSDLKPAEQGPEG